jgi:hypothetical protein
MKLRIFCILMTAALLLVSAAGFGCRGGLRDELDKHRRIWENEVVRDYQYRLQVLCFCPPEVTNPVIVEVKGGVTSSVIYVGTGLPVGNNNFIRYDTIEEMFQVIEDAINQNADEIKVEYNADLGYPTRIEIDFIKMAVDDEITYTISNFAHATLTG